MLVNNTEELGTRAVALTNVEGIDSNVAGSVFILTPGWNKVPNEVWPHAYPNMKPEIESGIFELKAKELDGELISMELQDVRADQAKQLIAKCFNPKTLERWKDNMKLSAELRNATDIQIKKINEFGEND